jgi:hypothetical protein
MKKRQHSEAAVVDVHLRGVETPVAGGERLHFAERMGTRGEDGYSSIPPLTHQVLAGYVGTTREIITLQMNHFRQKGMLRYSRKGIQVYSEALGEYLRTQERQGSAESSAASSEKPLSAADGQS